MAIAQGTILIIAYTLLSGLSLHAIFTERYQRAALLIFVLALALRIFMAGDLYLHDWDERFHAVIAKNIWSSPFAPQLYTDGVLDYDFARWSESDLWLSKPILPFWIMGSSIALFGANEFGLRLPSILIGLFSVWFTFKIGKQLFGHKPGLIAAFLHAVHGMVLEMGGGLISSDHVDTLFTLLFQLGIYCYLTNWRLRKRSAFLLLGFIFGLAFLTKWIMAFFALAIVAAVHLFLVKSPKQYLRDGSLVLAAFIATVIPWLSYLALIFPDEITLIFRQFLGRTGESFEGHTGGLFFYPEDVMILFGAGIFIVLSWMTIIAYRKQNPRHILVYTWAMLPLLLLSLMSTKRNTYLIMSAPAYFLMTGLLLTWLTMRPWNKWGKIALIALILGLPMQYSLERIKPFTQRFVWPEWRQNAERSATWTQRVAKSSGYDKIVIDGVSHPYHLMFFRDNIVAYSRKLTKEEVVRFEAAGYYTGDVRAGPPVQ